MLPGAKLNSLKRRADRDERVVMVAPAEVEQNKGFVEIREVNQARGERIARKLVKWLDTVEEV